MAAIEQQIISTLKSLDIRIDQDALVELAYAIEAPPSLDGFAVALNSMSKVLPVLIEISEGEDQALLIKWSDALQPFGACDTSCLPKHMCLPTLKANFCEERPLYSVLLKMPEFSIPKHEAVQLVAHFFRAYQCKYGFNDYNIGLAIRRICVKKHFQKSYDDFLSLFKADGLNHLISSLNQALGLETTDATRNHLLKLRSLFAVHKKKHGSGIEIKKPEGILDSKYIPGNQGVERDEDDPHASDVGSTITFREVSASKRASAIALGNAPEEAVSSREFASEQVDVDVPADIAKDLFRLKMRSTRVANAIAEGNQVLPTDWEQLNVFDLYILISGLQLLAEKVGDKKFGVPSEKLASALALSFIRGNPLALTVSMQSISTSKRKNSHTHHIVFERGSGQVICLSDGQLYSQGKRATLKMLGLVRPIDKSHQLEFRLPYWAGLIVINGAGAIVGKAHDETRLFSEPAEDYRDAARAWLSSIRKKHKNCRLTLGRLESFFVKYSMQASAFDIAEVAYVHGNPHAVQSTQLYYTAVNRGIINHIYSELWAAIQSSVMKEAIAIGNPSLFPEMLTQAEIPLSTLDSGYVGSEIVPYREAVSTLSSFLQEQEKQATMSNEPLWKWIVDYHNAFTTYTLYFLSYSTAYRAVCDPLPDPRLFDEQTQLLTISDKDDDDAYNTRLVWICDECKEQLNNYASHLEILKNKIIYLKTAVFDQMSKVQNAANALPNRPSKRKRLQERPWPPHLFFLKNDGSPETILPSMVEAKVAKVFPLPFNASRHFIRTELVMSRKPVFGRCPSHIIDAFMGHWLRGREPWAEFSTLSPEHFVEQLRPHMEELVASCGWRAIRSKLA